MNYLNFYLNHYRNLEKPRNSICTVTGERKRYLAISELSQTTKISPVKELVIYRLTLI